MPVFRFPARAGLCRRPPRRPAAAVLAVLLALAAPLQLAAAETSAEVPVGPLLAAEFAYQAGQLPEAAQVQCYPAVPLVPQRIANRERAQMLVESSSRAALQRLLPQLGALLHQLRAKAVLRWAVDVDPLSV